MKIMPLTMDNIEAVINNLSPDSAIEAKVFGMTSDSLKQRFAAFIDIPFTGAFYDENGSPCALGIMEPIAVNKWQSTFITAEVMSKETWRSFTRFWKKFTDDFIDKCDCTIEMESCLAHISRKVHRWYEMMGFRFLSIGGGVSRYVKGGGK